MLTYLVLFKETVMATKLLHVVYRQRYLVVGAVVVSSVTMITGAFISAIIGYTFSVGLLTAASHFIK